MTVAEIIEIAEISQFMAANDIANNGLYTGGGAYKRLPRHLYLVRKNVQRMYELDPTDDTLTATSNYLLALCGKYRFAAQSVMGGTGTIASISSGATINDLDFIVSASSYIATGESSVTFDGTGGMPDLRGYDVDFARNGTTQYTTPQAGGALYYGWNKVTGLFQLLGTNPEALEGESFRIMPDATGGTSSSSVVTTWRRLVISSASFEPDGVTCNLATIVGSEYTLTVIGFNQEPQFAGTFFDYTSTGFEIIWPGFDAADFGNIIIDKID